MSKIKVVLLCAIGVAAISAFGAPGASAALWLVAGNALFSKAAEGTQAAHTESVENISETSFDLTSTLTGGAKVVILCAKFKTYLGTISETTEDKPTDSGPEIEFEECKTDEPATCVVPAIIKVKETTTELFVDNEKVYDEFTPVASPFATIAVTGCAGEGSYKVTGQTCGFFLSETAAVEQLLEFVKDPLPSTEELCLLKFGVAEATFEGEAEVKLDGPKKGSAWAADKV